MFTLQKDEFVQPKVEYLPNHTYYIMNSQFNHVIQQNDNVYTSLQRNLLSFHMLGINKWHTRIRKDGNQMLTIYRVAMWMLVPHNGWEGGLLLFTYVHALQH